MAKVKELFDHLEGIEKQHGVEIIYAAVAGSRAWNTHTPTSDVDLRFIYKYPKDRYLRVTQGVSDSIVKKDEASNIESMGWDIRKAMKMLHKSNPSVVELFSIGSLLNRYQLNRMELLSKYADPYTLAMAYSGIAKGDLAKSVAAFEKDDQTTGVKAGISAVRCALSIGCVLACPFAPPTNIDSLVQAMEGSLANQQHVLDAIRNLIKIRREGLSLSRDASEMIVTHNWVWAMINEDFTRLKDESRVIDNEYIDQLVVDLISKGA